MAEQYQLPGEFRVPDLSAAIAAGGNQNARDQEAANNFIRQYDATTNITNANRMQSLRERQMAQEMINADRNFQLQKNQQENNFQIGSKEFDLRKEYQAAQVRQFDTANTRAQWGFRIEQDNYNQQQEALRLAPSWNEELKNRLGPRGAYGENSDQVIADFILEKGINPSYNQVLQSMVIPFKQQAQTYQTNQFDAIIANADAHASRGELDSIFFKDPENPGIESTGREILYKIKRARDEGDMSGLRSYTAQLSLGLKDYTTQKATKIQEEAMLRASQYGVPISQLDVEGGVVKAKFAPLTVAKGGTRTGTGVGTVEKPISGTEGEAQQNLKTGRDVAKVALDEADAALKGIDQNSASYALAKQSRDQLAEDYNTAKTMYESNARKIIGQEPVTTGNKLPATTPAPTQAPSVPQPSGAPSILNILKGAEKTTAKPNINLGVQDPLQALLSPGARRVESALQTAGMVGETALGVGEAVLGQLVPKPIQLAAGTVPVAQDVAQYMGELSAMRKIRAKAQLAANTRADRGENATKALEEEILKAAEEYKLKNQPSISVR
jgi:hypothetical protein